MKLLTSSQVATLQRVLAACNHVLPRIELLERLSEVNPGLKQRVRELRDQREYQVQLATTALEVERQLDTKDAYSLHGGVHGPGRD